MGIFILPLIFIFFLIVLGIGIRLFIIGIREKDIKSKLMGLAGALLAIIVGYITINNMLNGM